MRGHWVGGLQVSTKFLFEMPGTVQETIFIALKFTHPAVMSLFQAFVTMVIGAVGGGFRDRKAPIRSHVAVGALK